jgi:hypothetical protein
MSGGRRKIAKRAAVRTCADVVGFALVALAILAFARAGLSARPQAPSGSDWTAKNFPAIFDQLFSIRQAEGDFIAVRAHRSGANDTLEFSFVLENTQDAHAIRARLSEAQGPSLYQQLAALHSSQPSKSAAELEPELKVQTSTLSVQQCPAIATQFQAFGNIQFVRPRDDDPVDEHPILYQFHESVGGGDSEVTEFVESRAFPKWANATRKALAMCDASARPSGTE